MSSNCLATPVAAPAAAVENQCQESDDAHEDKGKKIQSTNGMEVPSLRVCVHLLNLPRSPLPVFKFLR